MQDDSLRRAAWVPALFALGAWAYSLAVPSTPPSPAATVVDEPTPEPAEPVVEPAPSIEPTRVVTSVPARPIELVDVDLRVAALRGLEVAERLAESSSAGFNAAGGAPETSLPLAMQHASASRNTLRPYCGVAIAATERPDWVERARAAVDACREAGASAIFVPRTVGLGVRREVGGLLSIDHESLDLLFEGAFASGLVVVIEGPPPPSRFAPLAGNPDRALLRARPEEHFHGARPDRGAWPTHAQLLDALEARLARTPGPTLVLAAPGAIPVERLRSWLARHADLRVAIDPRAPETVPLLTEHAGRVLVGSGAAVTPDGVRLRDALEPVAALDALVQEHSALREALAALPDDASRAARRDAADALFGPARPEGGATDESGR
jgi:hypothetical protein